MNHRKRILFLGTLAFLILIGIINLFAPISETAWANLAPTVTPRRQAPRSDTFRNYLPMIMGPTDGFTLINQDLASGLINLNQATTYKIYALFKNPLLPSRYQSGALIPQEGTVAYLETLANWEQLDTPTKQVLIDFLTPVDITQSRAASSTSGRRVVGCDLWWVRTTSHFWIFYPLSGPCVGRVNAQYIDNLATGLEAVWQTYSTLGYQMPPVTEVYVVPMQSIAPGISAPGRIFVTNAIDLAGNYGGNSGSLYLQTIAAHEFFHAVQWGYFAGPPICRWIGSIPPYAIPSPFPDAWVLHEDVRWWMESTAQWAQHEAYPVDRTYFQLLSDYLLRPWKHIDTRPILGDNFTYGTVLLPIYFAERLPAQRTIIRATWERYSQLNLGCGPMMPALQSALQTQGTTIEQLFPGFVEANYSLAYQRQADFRTVLPRLNNEDFRPNPEQRALSDANLNVVGPLRTDGRQAIEHLGSTYIEFANGFSNTLGRALTVTVDLYVNNPSTDPVIKFWAIQQYTPTVISKTIVPHFQLADTSGSTRRYVAQAGVPGFDSYRWVAMALTNPQTAGSVITYTYSAGVIPPAVIYAGGNSKGFVSTNGGATWITYTFPSTVTVQAVTAVTNTQGLIGYVGTSDLRLWKTTDAGQTFTPIYDFTPKVPITTTTSAHRIALVEVDPNNSNIVYAGVRWSDSAKWIVTRNNSGALFKSTDGGNTFGNDILSHNNSVWIDGAIYSLAIDPRNSNIVYIGQDGYNNIIQEAMRSADGGSSWTSLSNGTVWSNNGGPARVKVSSVDSSSIFAITGENQGHGVYHSTNSGTSWTRIAQPLGGQWSGFYGLVPALTNKDNAVASGTQTWISSVARTNDRFQTWQVINNTFGPNDLEGHPSAGNVLYAPYGDGVRWSFDGGFTWFDWPLDPISDVSVTRFGDSVPAPLPKPQPTPKPRPYP